MYSVLADEAADCGNKEQMAIVLRYVDSSKEQINLLKSQMAILRKSVEQFHSSWFKEAVDLAKDAGIKVPDGVHRICEV